VTTHPHRSDPLRRSGVGPVAGGPDHAPGDRPASPDEADTAALDLAPDARERPDGGRAEVVPLHGPRPDARLDRGGATPRGTERTRPTDPTVPSPRTGRRPGSPPDPARLVALLVRLTAEVAAGRRPVAQLEPLLAPTLLRRLAAQLRPGIARPDGPPRIRRVFVAPVSPTGAVEATALVEEDGRVTALAVRLERHRGLWRATELTAPESGYRPLPTRSDPLGRRGPDAFDEAASEAEDAAAQVTRRRGTA
jgi:hypothetical protein